MPEFPTNPHRRAPYKQFKFTVRWDGQEIPGVYRVSGLTRYTTAVSERSGEDPNVVTSTPGTTEYEPIVLERGRTHDTAFEDWANAVHDVGRERGTEVGLKDYQKDIAVDLLNEAGQVALSFRVYGCWPSKYSALGELDATVCEPAVESLTLQHAGWERDESVGEPAELSAAGE